MGKRRLLELLVLVPALVAGGCVTDDEPPAAWRGAVPAPGDGDVVLASASLETFADCAELTQWFAGNFVAVARAEGQFLAGARRGVADSGEVLMGTSAPSTGSGAAAGAGAEGAQRSASADAAAPAPSPAAPGTANVPAHSTTNVQEQDVDEPDLVKTDGGRIVVVSGNQLHVFDPDGPRLAGSLALGQQLHAAELLLAGDRAVVFGRGWENREAPARATAASSAAGSALIHPAGRPVTSVSLVDLAPTNEGRAPQLVESRTFEGEYVTARAVGDRLRLVLRSGAEVAMSFRDVGELDPEAFAAAAGELAEGAELADWVPNDELVDCERVHRPATFSGLGTTSVLTFELGRSATPIDTASVVADTQTVYASERSLYLATSRWAAPLEGYEGHQQTVELHRFDIGAPERAVYEASGSVPGRLLNQWSLSEHDGHLRVAVTQDGAVALPAEEGGDDPAASPAVPPQVLSESAVIVLQEEGDALVEVGRVGGLGRNEDIQAVRFMGDRGFVVTFRRIDPLYVLDLSNPEAPSVRGELKIPGYSAYLHPVDDGVLLGVGQDATLEGRALGTQVSLFDVRDPAAPKRTANITVPGAHSSVEHDARAFLWWAADDLAVIPLNGAVNGLLAVQAAGADTLVERARLQPGGEGSRLGFVSVDRSLVVGDRLYGWSPVGLTAWRLDGFAEAGFAAVPNPCPGCGYPEPVPAPGIPID